MKLRLRENSIRLRLLQSEVEKSRMSGSVTERIRFGQFQALTYTLKISDGGAAIFARFENDEIFVEIPSDSARNWTETNLVELEGEQWIDENLKLKILIEKDFVCLERPLDADNVDAFPQPKTNC